jgi:hypothetical protein
MDGPWKIRILYLLDVTAFIKDAHKLIVLVVGVRWSRRSRLLMTLLLIVIIKTFVFLFVFDAFIVEGHILARLFLDILPGRLLLLRLLYLDWKFRKLLRRVC